MKPRGYFYGIDFIRFCAALLVVLYHLGYYTDAVFQPVWPAVWFGWVGVEIFFVISGFVIANSANGSSPTRFLRGRILRLYPAAWVCATITLLTSIAASGGSFFQLFPIYFKTLALFPNGPWIDNVYWTLAVEIGFYTLIFSLLCAGAFSYLSRVALVLTILSSLFLSLLAARLSNFVPQSQFTDLMDSHRFWALVRILLAQYGCFFALGIWLWISTTRTLRKWERVATSVSIVSCVGEIWLRGTLLLPREVGGVSWIIPAVFFWSAAMACLMVFSRPHSLVPLPDNTARRIRTIGLMTYPLYLVHCVVGQIIVRAALSIGINKWIALTSGVLFMIFLSWVICKFCEPLIRKMLALSLDGLFAQRIFAPSLERRKP